MCVGLAWGIGSGCAAQPWQTRFRSERPVSEVRVSPSGGPVWSASDVSSADFDVEMRDPRERDLGGALVALGLVSGLVGGIGVANGRCQDSDIVSIDIFSPPCDNTANTAAAIGVGVGALIMLASGIRLALSPPSQAEVFVELDGDGESPKWVQRTVPYSGTSTAVLIPFSPDPSEWKPAGSPPPKPTRFLEP